MIINENTKLSDLLKEYPDLKAKLTSISPKFKMPSTPLGKVMINKATIAEMSKRSGIPVDELIIKIEKLI